MKAWSEITPALLHAELRRIGYTEIDKKGPSGSTWVDPNNAERPAVLVPHAYQEDLRGYEELLGSAVERISWALEIPVSEAIERLMDRGDRVELRILDDVTRGGRLPIVRAPHVVKGFLQLLRAGARAEFIGTQAQYQGNDTEVVKEALGGIDLLAPAKGSFRLIAVASAEVQMPFDPKIATPDNTRRALAATVRGLHAAADVTRRPATDDPEKLTPAIHRGVSALLMGGLEEISKRAPGTTVDFKVQWDPSLPEVDAPDQGVELDQSQLSRVPRLAKRLRQHEPDEHRVVRGWVKTASADELAKAGHPTGLAVVEARIEKSMRSVYIDLPAALFERALPGQTQLTAKGTLQKIGNRWHLSDPHDIEIKDVGAAGSQGER
jgi:hypothetical protein